MKINVPISKYLLVSTTQYQFNLLHVKINVPISKYLLVSTRETICDAHGRTVKDKNVKNHRKTPVSPPDVFNFGRGYEVTFRDPLIANISGGSMKQLSEILM